MQPRIVTFSPEAKDDLRKLYDWLAETASPNVAIKYIGRIESYCMGLTHLPERGNRRDDVREGLRIQSFEKRISIAFNVEDERVVILGLFYAGRNWEAQFD